jgi:hypothetical protein
MLQRIQTLWLLLAGVAAILTFKFPYYSGATKDGLPYAELNALNGGWPLVLATIVVAAIALVAIGLYSKRVIQLRLCVVGIIAEAILLYLYFRKTSAYTDGTMSLTSILHMCILLFFVLAARGISRDEKLVRESDRFR